MSDMKIKDVTLGLSYRSPSPKDLFFGSSETEALNNIFIKALFSIQNDKKIYF